MWIYAYYEDAEKNLSQSYIHITGILKKLRSPAYYGRKQKNRALSFPSALLILLLL